MRNFTLKSDGIGFKLVERNWEEYHGLTAALITLNEEDRIRDYIEHVRPFVKKIVMIDGGSIDRTVEIAEPYVDMIKIVPFSGHFANQKNEAMKLVNTDWTIFLDPDERLSSDTIEQIPSMINQDEFDCYRLPRKEIIDGAENKDPYPDYQSRIFRTYCRFVRPVHEEVVGFKNSRKMEADGRFDILHSKCSKRHKERNTAYSLFEVHYAYEQGKPGEQMLETISKPENTSSKKDANV